MGAQRILKPLFTPKKKAKQLLRDYKDVVMIDYRGDEEPIFELQKKGSINSSL